MRPSRPMDSLSRDLRSRRIFFKSSAAFLFLILTLLISANSRSYALDGHPNPGGLSEKETLSMENLRKKLDGATPLLVVDARAKKSYDEGHIKGAISPMTEDYYRREELFRQGGVRDLPDVETDLREATYQYPKDILIVTYCSDHCQASTVLL